MTMPGLPKVPAAPTKIYAETRTLVAVAEGAGAADGPGPGSCATGQVRRCVPDAGGLVEALADGRVEGWVEGAGTTALAVALTAGLALSAGTP
jgi:hypothetical protein